MAVRTAGSRRPRVAGGRPVQVQVMFSVEEYQAVAARAIASGLTVPSYLAVAAVRPEGTSVGEARSALTNITGVRRVLAGVASNLNQLTHKLHGTGEVDAALPAVVAAVERISERVDQAIAEVAAVVGGGPR